MDYRKDWERLHGISIPEGWEVHHRTYRSKGGTDAMNNLDAMPRKLHVKMHKGEAYERMIANGVPKSNFLKGDDRTDNQKAGRIKFSATATGSKRTTAAKLRMSIAAKKRGMLMSTIRKANDSVRVVGIDEASELCEAYATGLYTQKEIGSHFKVHQSAISKIINKGGVFCRLSY